jgi:hypothetical protein
VNGLAVDEELPVCGVDVALEAAVDGVELEHVNLHFPAIRSNSAHNDMTSTDHVIQLNEGTVNENQMSV